MMQAVVTRLRPPYSAPGRPSGSCRRSCSSERHSARRTAVKLGSAHSKAPSFPMSSMKAISLASTPPGIVRCTPGVDRDEDASLGAGTGAGRASALLDWGARPKPAAMSSRGVGRARCRFCSLRTMTEAGTCGGVYKVFISVGIVLGWAAVTRLRKGVGCNKASGSPRWSEANGIMFCKYRKSTNSRANLPTPMFWHKVLHQ
jgi:hypothetical protein